MTQDEEHELRNYLAALQLKAQLLDRVAPELLNLKDTSEKIAVGYLAALLQMSEKMDTWERQTHRKPPTVWERIKAWLNRFTS